MGKRKSWKRIASAGLSTLMLFSALSTVAFASDTNENVTIKNSSKVDDKGHVATDSGMDFDGVYGAYLTQTTVAENDDPWEGDVRIAFEDGDVASVWFRDNANIGISGENGEMIFVRPVRLYLSPSSYRDTDVTTTRTFRYTLTSPLKVTGDVAIRSENGYSDNGQLTIEKTITVADGGTLLLDGLEKYTQSAADPDIFINSVDDGPAVLVEQGGKLRIGWVDLQTDDSASADDGTPFVEVEGGEVVIQKASTPNGHVNGSSVFPDEDEVVNEDTSYLDITTDETLIKASSGATVTIKGGEITSTSDEHPAIVFEGSEGAENTLTILGGILKTTGQASALEIPAGTTVTLVDGAVNSDNANVPAITVSEGGKLEIPADSETVVKVLGTSEDEDAPVQAIALEGGAVIQKAGTVVTVAEPGGGAADESYVDNNGVVFLARGASRSGGSDEMNAAVILSDGTIVEGSETEAPTVATNESGEITVSVPEGGRVTNADNNVVEMPNGGSVTESGGSEGGTTVTPTEVPATGISLDRTSVALYSNTTPNTVTLTATVEPSSTTDTVVWSSDNESVATVDGNGVVTAVSNGTATITATAGDVSATCIVTVTTYSGGSSGVTRYSIAVEDTDNGAAEVSPTRASRGSTVTITVTPDEGYELNKLTVTDSKGNELALTDKGNGKYTFTMPASKVTVVADFTQTGTEQPEGLPFTDVAEGAYYYDAVAWAVENGVTEGTSATTFSPDLACTRAQMVTFLWRAAGSPEPTTANNPFTDIQSGAYYYDAVLWAVEQGITEGTSATNFNPDAVCTRAQTVTFLWRQAGAPVVNYAMSFTDVAADAYYTEAVRWAVSEGVTVGTSETTFSPNVDCTRAQIVTFMYRAAQ